MNEPFESLTYRERLLVNHLAIQRQCIEMQKQLMEDHRLEMEALRAELVSLKQEIEGPRLEEAVWIPRWWYVYLR
jgi:hypothetical protein